MQVPFKHPLATHAAGTVLGQRRNGSPIYAIAGGSDEGEGGSGSGSGGQGSAGDGGQGGAGDSGAAGGDGSQGTGQQSGQGEGQGGSSESDSTDWKAHARQWEKRAKENAKAADELEKLKASQMSDQEKAVSEAEKRGRTAAAVEHGQQLASAKFEAAAANAGVKLDADTLGLINTRQFVGKDGTVDADAIQAAVRKLAKLAPKGPGRSGADLGGGSGDTPPSVDKQIAEAQSKGDWRTVMRLQNSKLAAAEAAQQ